MVTVLLTGSNGFIGKNLKERLLKDGYNVICFDRKLDLAKHFYAKDVDVVINCAGEIKNTEKMFNTNLLFLYNLLFHAKTNGVKKFIQIGSSSELGNTNAPRSEKSAADPKNFYQATKAAATMICQGFANDQNFDVCIARPFTIYGKYEQSNRFIPSLWNAFLNDKQFHLYPGNHDYVHVDDFVNGILLLLKSNKQVTIGQIFHFGTGYSTSNKDIVKMFQKYVVKELNIVEHKEKFYNYDCENWASDTTKSNLLGWKPIHIYDGIKKYIDYLWFSEEKTNNLSH
jgi:nucleoside-diphosphate-sugar epimerase